LASDAESGSAVADGRLNDSKWRHGAVGAVPGAGAGPAAGAGVATGAGSGAGAGAAAAAIAAAAATVAAGVSEAGHTNESPAAGAGAGVPAGVASGAAATAAAGSVLPHDWQLVWPRKTSRAPQNWHVWLPAPCPNINSTSHPPRRVLPTVPASMTPLDAGKIAGVASSGRRKRS
jgi:hypothetical protein